MSIRLSLYDFFAYTIPGAFYLLAAVYFGIVIGLVKIDQQTLSGLSLTQVVLLAIPAYVLGMALSPAAQSWYRRVFKRSAPTTTEILQRVKNDFPHLDIKYDANDWYVLLQVIRKENSETAESIERFNVSNLMLRNLSFAFLLLAIIQLIQLVRGGLSAVSLLAAVVISILSILCGRESVKFRLWFYEAIYQAVVVQSIDPKDLVERVGAKTDSRVLRLEDVQSSNPKGFVSDERDREEV